MGYLKNTRILPEQGTILIQTKDAFVGVGRNDIMGVIGDVYLVESCTDVNLACYCKRLGPDKRLDTSLDARFRLSYKNETLLWKKY